MKVIQTVLLAVSMVSPAALAWAAPVSDDQSYAIQAIDSEVPEYADAFAGAARQALVSLQNYKSKNDSDVSTGITQARIIQVGALDLIDLVKSGASEDELTSQLLSLESHVYQLDAIKRRLQSKYKDTDLTRTLTYVRTLYLNLKIRLTGEDL